MKVLRVLGVLGVLVVPETVVGADLQVGPARQTEEDDYTRYELMAPDTQAFAIIYDVTATMPGARFYFNPIRKGSEASDERVIDLMSGETLKFDVVGGADAKQSGHPAADADTSYIRVHLPRPVPKEGEVRLRIYKTYKDPKSYYRKGDHIVFDRSLGIRRNSVLLPTGYELVACNVPSQVLSQPFDSAQGRRESRILVSFMNPGPAAAPLVLRASPLPARGTNGQPTRSATTSPLDDARGALSDSRRAVVAGAQTSTVASAPSIAARLTERAFQDREIVYFLHQPDSHAFSLYHDYTESREGIDKYLNVVRAGSTVSNPSARVLDTGEPLRVETLAGAAITAAKIDIGEPVKPDSEVVVIRFPAVKRGQSLRLRISETYTDPARYRVDGGALVWDRGFGRPRNTVVLPEGWYLTDNAVPASITQMEDGRIRLYFENNRPDEIATLVRARRRLP